MKRPLVDQKIADPPRCVRLTENLKPRILEDRGRANEENARDVDRLIAAFGLSTALTACVDITPFLLVERHRIEKIRNGAGRLELRVVVADKIEVALANVDALVAESEVCSIGSAHCFVEVLPRADFRHRRGDGGDRGDCDENSKRTRP